MGFVFVMIIALSLSLIDECQAGRIKNKHFFEKGDEVHFKMGDKEFRVKKDYFRGGSQNYWGAISNAEFWALLPDFETYDKDKNYSEFVTQLGYGRRIWFKIHPSHDGRNSLSKIFERGKTNGFHRFSGRVDQFDEMKYGLEVYRSTTKWDDQYLYRPNGNLKVLIGCRSIKANLPSPGCLMKWDYSNKVYAEADFSMEYLPQWKDILTNIEKIINGQRIDSQGEGKSELRLLMWLVT